MENIPKLNTNVRRLDSNLPKVSSPAVFMNPSLALRERSANQESQIMRTYESRKR